MFNRIVLLTFSFLLLYYIGFAQHRIAARVLASPGTSSSDLEGTTVALLATGTVTSTDAQGWFTIEIRQFPAILRFSAVGYQERELLLTKPEDMPDTVLLQQQGQALDQVVVTAGRVEQHLKDVPQKIEVVTAIDIERTPALDVTDVLKKTTAVNVIQYPGILSGVGVRGFRPQFSGLTQRTLLLINGRPAGTTNLGTIDLNNIERMEVLKGPASALYGSQAMGGVVNIITPQSSGSIHGNLFADYGSYSTYQFGGKAGGSISERMDFDASLTYFQRDENFKMGNGNLFRGWLGADEALYQFADGRDSLISDTRGDGQTRPNTRYGYYTGSARVGYLLAPHWRLDASATLFRADDVESPGDIASGEMGAGLKDILRNNGELSLAGVAGRHDLNVRLYYANERSTSYVVRTPTGDLVDDPYLMNINDYAWYGAQIRDALTFGKQRLIVGYDFNHASSKVKNHAAPVDGVQQQTANAPDAAIFTHAVYAQGQLSFLDDRLKVNPGLRLDLTGFATYETSNYTRALMPETRHNAFVSPSLSMQYALLSELIAHGSIGRAFVTPDASQVAGNIIAGKGSGRLSLSQGNPNLRNESSISEEIGLRYQATTSGWMADAVFFHTTVKDRIAFRSAPPETPQEIDGEEVISITNYYNAHDSRIHGLELMGSYDFGALADFRYSLRLFTNLTRTFRAEDLTVGTDGSTTVTAIPNVATSNVNYGLEYANNRDFSIRLSGRFSGRRWDTDFSHDRRPLVYYPEFMTLDLATSYTFLKAHQLTLTLSNLTDENYYEKRGFSLMGRAYRLRYTLLF